MKKISLFMLLAALFPFTQQAIGAEISYSGFGTIGYAQSDQSYAYQRFIKNSGGFTRDSVVGAQADVKFNPEWGATVQAKLAPSVKSDSQWDASFAWAFLSWRSSNNLLIRLGKQRVPLYLYSETMDVGATYDFARLPTEMYSVSPTTDYTGGSFSQTWSQSIGELTLDGYAGSTDAYWRMYQRENIKLPGGYFGGANFIHSTMESAGLVLTLLRDEDKYRASIHQSKTSLDAGNTFTLYDSPVSGTGVGLPAGTTSGTAYTVLPQATSNSLNATVLTLGAEINLPENFRVIGEYNGRRLPETSVNGLNSNGGYLALLKNISEWTPYVSYAAVQSTTGTISHYQALNGNPGLTALVPVPAVLAGVAGVNASQRILADYRSVIDQSTLALGTSYRVNATQKIKAEWARTHVGVVSSFVDAPSGGDVGNQDINVLSLVYSAAF